MAIENIRTQYAVGQGYFQTGELSDNQKLRLRYVVDCGAMTKYASQRDARIDAYLSQVGAGQSLDILFISHAHADHLNGVARLLNKAGGLVVKTIVLPLLNIEDRLIAYARAALEDARSARSAFYKDFVADPASAFRRFNPDRIIFVEPGSRDDGAPFSGSPDDPLEGPNGSAIPSRDNTEVPWKLVGRGTVRLDDKSPTKLNGSVVSVIPDSLGLICASAGTSPAWLLAPYVDPSVNAGSVLFMKSLAAARGQSLTAFMKWLRITKNIKELLTLHVSDLKIAYAAIHSDLNITSMCLYSGPVPISNPPLSYHCGQFGKWAVSGTGNSRVAWLGTGDAALANKKRLNAFFKHYGSLLQEVVTMTLPHHGSEHNFDAQLLIHIQPSFCVAAADRFSKWRHPGTSVVQSIASTGHFLSVVTSKVQSEVTEMVTVN